MSDNLPNNPTQGGSYVQQKDGTLKRVARTATEEEAAAAAAKPAAAGKPGEPAGGDGGKKGSAR